MPKYTTFSGLVDETPCPGCGWPLSSCLCPADDLMCENCLKRAGHTNSRYLLDENGDGKWVCIACEESMESEQQCPCGCGNNPENCAYAGSLTEPAAPD